MTLTCTNVTLRQKPLRNDRISLYLDYYPAIRNPYTMKMSRREFLGIYIYAKPKNEHDEDESPGIPRHLHLCQAQERAAKNVQSGYAEQGRGNPLYPCPVSYQ